MLGAALFQLQDYAAAQEHLERACQAEPEREAWAALLQTCRRSAANGVQLRRAPVEPFRAEQLVYPAALHLRAPEGVLLPTGPSPREQRIDKLRDVTGHGLGWVVSKLLQLVGVLGPANTWQAKERLATRAQGKSRFRLLQGARAGRRHDARQPAHANERRHLAGSLRGRFGGSRATRSAAPRLDSLLAHGRRLGAHRRAEHG